MNTSLITIIIASEIILILLVAIAFLAYRFNDSKRQHAILRDKLRKNKVSQDELDRARDANQQILQIIDAVKNECSEGDQTDSEDQTTKDYLVTKVRLFKQGLAEYEVLNNKQQEMIESLQAELAHLNEVNTPADTTDAGLEISEAGEAGESDLEVIDGRDTSKQQISTLQNNYQEQTSLINEIKHTLEDPTTASHTTLLEKVSRLERLLSESDTAVQMLENELSILTPEPGASGPEGGAGTGDESAIEGLETQLQSANDMIMNMMTMSGDQSYIVGFTRETINCHSYEQLVDNLLEMASAMSVEAVVQVRGTDQVVNRGHKEDISDKLSYFEVGGNGERFEMINGHVLIRFPTISLLLCNMSEEDESVVGRRQDTFATILELAVSKIERINVEQTNARNQALLEQVVTKSDAVLGNVEKNYLEQKQLVQGMLRNLADVAGDEVKSENSASVKDRLKKIIKDNELRLNELFKPPAAVDGTFKTLISTLSERFVEG